MYRGNKFMDIMKLFPKAEFKKLVEKHQGDRCAKSFSCFDLLVSMMYGQLSGTSSLREIETGFNAVANCHYHLGVRKVHRSTLSDWNNRTNPQIFQEICLSLMRQVSPKFRKSIQKTVELIDSSPIQLKSKAYQKWCAPTHNPRIQGLKLHMGYQPDTDMPTRLEISDANISDIRVAQRWQLTSGYLYIFDKGYYDYNWWHKINETGSAFVTRLKSNAAFKHIDRHSKPVGTHILSDDIIHLTNKVPRGGAVNLYYHHPLRRVCVAREAGKSPLVLVTNCFDLEAEQIAELYKERWQIELFFKKIKQNLKIKKFCGTSKQAVMIQIYIALITYCLLSLYRQASRAHASFHMVMVGLRCCLFSKHEDIYNKRRRIEKNYQSEPQLELAI